MITYVRPRPVGAVLGDLGEVVLGVAALHLVEVRLLLIVVRVSDCVCRLLLGPH